MVEYFDAKESVDEHYDQQKNEKREYIFERLPNLYHHLIEWLPAPSKSKNS